MPNSEETQTKNEQSEGPNIQDILTRSENLPDAVPVPLPQKPKSRFGPLAYFLVIFLIVLASLLSYIQFNNKPASSPQNQNPPATGAALKKPTPVPVPAATSTTLSQADLGNLQKLDSSSSLGFTKIVTFSPTATSSLAVGYQMFVLPGNKNLKAQKTIYADKTQGIYISYLMPNKSTEEVDTAFTKVLGSSVINSQQQGAARLIEANTSLGRVKILHFSSGHNNEIVSVEIIAK